MERDLLFEETYYEHFRLMTPEEERSPFARILQLDSESMAEEDPLIRRWRRYVLYGLYEKIEFESLLRLPRYLVDDIFTTEAEKKKSKPTPPIPPVPKHK